MPLLAAAHRRNLAPMDPLAGIGFRLRFEAYDGSGAPIGMFTDTAGTVPVSVPDVDLIAAIRNARGDGLIAATQSTGSSKFGYTLEDSKPAMYLDGSDDHLDGTLLAAGEALVVRAKLLTDLIWNGAMYADSATGGTYHPFVDTNFYEDYGSSSRVNGIVPGATFPDWFVYRCENVGGTFRAWVNGALVKTASVSVRTATAFRIGSSNTADLSHCWQGLLSHEYVLNSAADGAAVESFLLALP